MLWRLFDVKPLLDLMMTCYKLQQCGQTPAKIESEYDNFYPGKCIPIYRLQNGGHFVQDVFSKHRIGTYIAEQQGR